MTNRVCISLVACWLVFAQALTAAAADIPASARTADLPDSWLVLYNLNDSDSVAWRDWYIQQWGIPAENTLGLAVSAGDERIHTDTFRDDIFDVVAAHLAGNPDLAAKIMGILVGYRVPGNVYLDATHPVMQGGGGWSVSNNLCDLNSATWYKRFNPHYRFGAAQLSQPRLTKATLSAGFYLTGRIDAPTLADAQALTTRARAITLATAPLPDDEWLYYDYTDVGAAGGDTWQPLANLSVDPTYQDPVRFPWLEFESETDAAPLCAVQFSYYRVTGWQNVNWGGTPAGTRIVGYALNSFGATTVRSTTDHGGRYVPNALVNGGFAAAFGATAEPFLGNEPQPSTVLWCLAEGRTLAEASSHASPYVNYMWEAVGDPLMRVPYWFSAEPTVDFTQSEYDANEGDGAVMLTVRLSFASGESVEVDYATLDGTAQAGSDYVAKSGTLVFAPGAQERTISITLLDDDVEEADAQFHVMLSNPVSATLAGVNDPADVIIIDDDPPAPDDEGGDGGGGGGGVIPQPPAPDADGDGVPDAIDACPDDPNKVDPGLCGCGVADSDRDGDDVPDCLDDCPDDVGKSHPGLCGCGMPENCGPIDPGGGGDPLPGDEVQDDEVPGDEPAEDDAPTNGMAPGNSDGEEDQSSGQPPSDEEAARGLCGAGMTLGLLTVTLLLYGLRLSRMRRR